MQPGDEWGDDNPGNVHGVGVDDHVFFHRDGAGPHAGKVIAHGVHGCTVEDDGGTRHKVRWGRVHGLKKRAALPAQVVDRGEAGAIVQHPDGRRVFVAGDLGAAGLDEPTPRFRDVAGLEDAAREPKKRPKLAELEEFARAGGRERDLAKADHDCEGPALCRVCREARAAAAAEPLLKAHGPGSVEQLEVLARRLRAARGPRSLLKSFVPVVLRRP